MQNSQSNVFDINTQLSVFIIQLMKKMIENFSYHLKIHVGSKNDCIFKNNQSGEQYKYYNPEGTGVFFYLYERSEASKYFSGVILDAMKDGSLYLYKDLETGSIQLELSLLNEEIIISSDELKEANIHLDKFFDHIEGINNSDNNTFTTI